MVVFFLVVLRREMRDEVHGCGLGRARSCTVYLLILDEGDEMKAKYMPNIFRW